MVEDLMENLTFESINVRAAIVPLRRPIVAKVGQFTEWPLILIDVQTKEGIYGLRVHSIH